MSYDFIRRQLNHNGGRNTPVIRVDFMKSIQDDRELPEMKNCQQRAHPESTSRLRKYLPCHNRSLIQTFRSTLTRQTSMFQSTVKCTMSLPF